MATEELYKVTIVGLQQDKGTVLDFLQEKGIMHLSQFEEVNNEHALNRDRPMGRVDEIVSYLLEFEWMAEHLCPYKKHHEEAGFEGRDVTEAVSDALKLKNLLHNRLSKVVTQFNKNTEALEQAKATKILLESVPFDLEKGFTAPSKGIYSFTYLLSIPPVDEELDLTFPGGVTVLEEENAIIVQGHEEDREAVQERIKEIGLSMVSIPKLSKSKKEILNDIKIQTKTLTKENKELESKLKSLASTYCTRVLKLKHELQIFHDRYEASGQFLTTESTFVLEGYVPMRASPTLKKLNKLVRVHVEFHGLEEGPTKLRNFSYVSHFEFITKMFGVPMYGRVDPTAYISIFLPFFFGFMFSDIGYGILLAMSAWWLLRKATPRTPILHDAGYVLIVCAATTIIFGFLFGSFFGNLIKIQPLLFDPFVNAKWVLIYALGVGLIHLNFGILTGMYECVRQGQYRELVLKYVSILSLEAGAYFLAIGQPAGWAFLAGAITLFIMKEGVMGVMGVSGFLGTWFSYARLLALGLATGGIALGINIMAEQLMQVHLLGPVLFVVLIVFGHLFNFVLNVLGSSIHSVRLHYIEFFGQFYEGGGLPFNEFTTKRVKDSI